MCEERTFHLRRRSCSFHQTIKQRTQKAPIPAVYHDVLVFVYVCTGDDTGSHDTAKAAALQVVLLQMVLLQVTIVQVIILEATILQATVLQLMILQVVIRQKLR